MVEGKDIYVEATTLEQVNKYAEEGYVVDKVYVIPAIDLRGEYVPAEIHYLMTEGEEVKEGVTSTPMYEGRQE